MKVLLGNISKVWRAAFAVSLLLLFCANARADYLQQIRRASYLFEMRGEKELAKSLLKDASENGSEKERAEADFLLGKIEELEGNYSTASFFYKENILKSEIPAQVYFSSERLALMDNRAFPLLNKRIALPASIRQVFLGDSTLLLLDNQTIFSQFSKNPISLSPKIPGNANILHISNGGVWWEDGSNLRFYPLKKIFSEISIPIKKLTDFKAIAPNLTMYLDEGSLVLLTGNSEIFRTEARYRDCSILDMRAHESSIWINCPDYALHQISKKDGRELGSISMYNPISKAFQDDLGMLLFSGDELCFYAPGKFGVPLWRDSSNAVENMVSFGKYFAILESSGSVLLRSKKTGRIVAARSGGTADLLSLNTGLLGLLSRNGALTAVDTLLRPLWRYHFGKSPEVQPWVNEGKLYYASSSDSLQVLDILHYGKKLTAERKLSEEANHYFYLEDWENVALLADSLQKLEPGNSEALYFKARYLEKIDAPLKKQTEAWLKVIHSDPEALEEKRRYLFDYSKKIGAKFIVPLELSPNTPYPQFFHHKKFLYTLDPALRQLLCIQAETGDIQWIFTMGKMESSPVVSHRENWLAVASGLSLGILDLSRPKLGIRIREMPAKIFQMAFTDDALFVSTWNGFLVKILLGELRQAWARKIDNEPFFLIPRKNEIITASLSGTLSHIWNASGGQRAPARKLQTDLTMASAGDSAIAFLTDAQSAIIYKGNDTPLLTITPGKDIQSASFISFQGEEFLLLSLNDKELRLYSIVTGEMRWQYRGKASVFGKIALGKNSLWIDQGEEITEISIESGEKLSAHPVHGGAGTPFIAEKTLYSATPEHLLYAFPLE